MEEHFSKGQTVKFKLFDDIIIGTITDRNDDEMSHTLYYITDTNGIEWKVQDDPYFTKLSLV